MACTGNHMTCPVDECMDCAIQVCPDGEPLHFHHDGCPACDMPKRDSGIINNSFPHQIIWQRLEFLMKQFDIWSIALGLGGQFWLIPGFRHSRRKNIETWTIGWLYFCVMIQRLRKPPVRK